MKIRFIFRWYDLWIGMYIDGINDRVYLFPIPCFGLRIDLHSTRLAEWYHAHGFLTWKE